MTINELSRLTHVKSEAIRSYRLKGLLRPDQNPGNKYYDYSLKDLYSLLFIRKLREINMSLDSIQYTYHHESMSELLDEYSKEQRRIDEEIEQLQRHKRMMELTIDHLKGCEAALDTPSVTHSYGEKIDCFDLTDQRDPALGIWLEHKALFTQTLRVPLELLLSDPLPDHIPLECGIGTYRPLLDEYELPVPRRAIVYPDGLYATCTVELTQLETIKKEQLQPLLDYIAQNHYKAIGDTTAFLYRIAPSPEGHRLFYRMRVQIEPV